MIESFDFIGANHGVPVLLAVTAGEKPPVTTVTRGDAALAARLDEEARAALQAGNKARALELAQQAVAADATCVPARVRVGDLLEESGKLSEAEAQFRRVVELQPDHLETYLRIGRICEAQKRWDDALAIYRRSLEVNVNQPLAMQALERAKQLKKDAR
jgi:tetratricopeptide (TPR) repeat protein